MRNKQTLTSEFPVVRGADQTIIAHPFMGGSSIKRTPSPVWATESIDVSAVPTGLKAFF